MQFMIKLAQCKRGIEVGVFTGYSALCFALGMPDDGKLIAIDISEDYTNLGKKYWQLAGVDHKIDLQLGSGLEILNNLLKDESNHGSFDFAYIDADKTNYGNYFLALKSLLRKGGFIMIDNILWSGRVAD